jgi:hypothetical protein
MSRSRIKKKIIFGSGSIIFMAACVAALGTFIAKAESRAVDVRQNGSAWKSCPTVHFSIKQKARGISCARSYKVAKRAQKKFCSRPGRCSYYDPPPIERGTVRSNGWKCKVVRRPTSGHISCKRGKLRSFRSQAVF